MRAGHPEFKSEIQIFEKERSPHHHVVVVDVKKIREKKKRSETTTTTKETHTSTNKETMDRHLVSPSFALVVCDDNILFSCILLFATADIYSLH